MPHDTYPEPTLDGIRAWLAGMPDIDRARLIAVLTNAGTVKALAAVRAEDVYAITRRMTGPQAAELLGISASAVANVVNRRTRALRDAASAAPGE